MTQNTTIYLADDKDGKKVIVVGYASYLDSFSSPTQVGRWHEHVNDMDESWQDEPLIFEIDELFSLMRNPTDWMGWHDPDDPDDEPYDGLTFQKIKYGYYQLKNLCKRIVAGSEEPVTVRCYVSFIEGCMDTGWSADVTIDPVLAQAILDTYN